MLPTLRIAAYTLALCFAASCTEVIPPVDPGTDIGADLSVDSAADTGVDAATDSSPDVAVADISVDSTTPDIAPDVPPDLVPDVTEDLPQDNAVDTTDAAVNTTPTPDTTSDGADTVDAAEPTADAGVDTAPETATDAASETIDDTGPDVVDAGPDVTGPISCGGAADFEFCDHPSGNTGWCLVDQCIAFAQDEHTLNNNPATTCVQPDALRVKAATAHDGVQYALVEYMVTDTPTGGNCSGATTTWRTEAISLSNPPAPGIRMGTVDARARDLRGLVATASDGNFGVIDPGEETIDWSGTPFHTALNATGTNPNGYTVGLVRTFSPLPLDHYFIGGSHQPSSVTGWAAHCAMSDLGGTISWACDGYTDFPASMPINTTFRSATAYKALCFNPPSADTYGGVWLVSDTGLGASAVDIYHSESTAGMFQGEGSVDKISTVELIRGSVVPNGGTAFHYGDTGLLIHCSGLGQFWTCSKISPFAQTASIDFVDAVPWDGGTLFLAREDLLGFGSIAVLYYLPATGTPTDGTDYIKRPLLQTANDSVRPGALVADPAQGLFVYTHLPESASEQTHSFQRLYLAIQ